MPVSAPVRPPRARSAAALLVLAGALALAGCSGSGDASSASSTTGGTSGSEAGAAPAVAKDGAVPGAAAVPLSGRSVVRTGASTVQVDDVRTAADRARAVAEQAGGALEAEDASGGRDVLRLRVLPDQLVPGLDALARLGHETSRTVGSQDVTDEVVDVQSRIASQQASVDRVRALLAAATAVPDLVAVERELAQRESDLESLEARQKALQGQTDLATITLELVARTAPAAASGFRDGLSSGAHAFVAAARVSAVVLGAVLPFLPFLAAVLWLVRRLTRRPALPVPPAGGPATP